MIRIDKGNLSNSETHKLLRDGRTRAATAYYSDPQVAQRGLNRAAEGANISIENRRNTRNFRIERLNRAKSVANQPYTGDFQGRRSIGINMAGKRETAIAIGEDQRTV